VSEHDGSQAIDSRRTHSSGGVVYRRSPEDGEHEVALIATRRGTRWQLPKGTQEPGESSEETALREVLEETGLSSTVEAFLDIIHFSYWDTYRKRRPVRVKKSVDFYLMRVTGGRLSDESHEVDGVAWFTLPQALEILTFESERGVLRLAMAKLPLPE
jgi:8-oxo-dGTP pyrophosphatase MutT (NUDIX family)